MNPPRYPPLLLLLVLVGCDAGLSRDPVVVYAPDTFEPELEAWLGDSPFRVTVVFAASAENTDKVIENRGSPPADVLMTSGVFDVWRAADQGALRPIIGSVAGKVGPAFRDPDGEWLALGYRYASIVAAKASDAGGIRGYADLAAPSLAGRVCLSSFEREDNRALGAMLIEELGVKPAERVVRGWVRNLALPPLVSEAELNAALHDGRCDFAIVSSATLVTGLTRIDPEPRYFNIDGVGIARHARNPEAGGALVEWMLTQVSPRQPDAAGNQNVGLAAWRDEDARLLAERAGYR